MTETTSLDYGLNLENSTSWTSTSTLPEVQDTTKKDITTTIKDTPGNKEDLEIPQKLKDFREKWEKEIVLDKDSKKNAEKKKKIIDAVNKIQKGAKEESDGSMLVEFELGGKTYKTLDVNLAEHSDKEYLISSEYKRQTKNEVKLGGMWGDNPKHRPNKSLGDYVIQEKKNRRMEIWREKLLRDLINKLGVEADLSKAREKYAMWMYLTGCYGCYYLFNGGCAGADPFCSEFLCEDMDYGLGFSYNKDNAERSRSLFLIACE